MNSRIVQLLYLTIFIAVNWILFAASVPQEEAAGLTKISPTYHYASDGQRYWGVAINLAEHGRFVLRTAGGNVSLLDAAQASVRNRTLIEEPLVRAGPLPALLFSLPIKIFGFGKAAGYIVVIQCALLFLTGVIARALAEPFGWSKNLLQALLIFNPSLVGLAHLAQSETVFVFLITALLVFSTKFLLVEKPASIVEVGLFGLSAGLLPLARPLGLYVILALPIFLLISLWVADKNKRVRLRYLNSWRIAIVVAIAIAVSSVWAYRNYNIFGEFALTQSEGIMMQWHYSALRKIRGQGKSESDLFHDYFATHRVESASCDEIRIRGTECKRLATRIYLDAIIKTPPAEIGYALAVSWTKLFFSGGASTIARYIGVSSPNLSTFLHMARDSNDSFATVLKKIIGNDGKFFLLFLFTTSVAIFSRILGIVGLFTIRDRMRFSLGLFHFLYLSVFLSMYLFVGLSRFRAPLEPILMLYATGGIGIIVARFRTRAKQDRYDTV